MKFQGVNIHDKNMPGYHNINFLGKIALSEMFEILYISNFKVFLLF